MIAYLFIVIAYLFTFCTRIFVAFLLGFPAVSIRITCPCDLYPLTPHFYILKLGCTGVYIFLIFALKHRLWVLISTASLSQCLNTNKNEAVLNEYPQSMF